MSKLYVVPTPIGNLGDITYRAVEVLQLADFILCEDTRTSSKLLKHLNISKPTYSYHAHNEHRVLDSFITKIQDSQQVALISDAGTPAISDPGFLLVKACISSNIEVECLPGATALIPALVHSGLPNNRFVFEGFLPIKKVRQSRLKNLEIETRTLIFYESPHNLLKTLLDFKETFGKDRLISLSREISKIYHETIRGTIEEVEAKFINQSVKGEIVIVINGYKR